MKTCEAILVTHGNHKNKSVPSGRGVGKVCGETATHEFNGKPVCWCHFTTCTKGPRACGMGRPVEFAEAQ